MLNPEKWRVAAYSGEVPVEAVSVQPWMLDSLVAAPATFKIVHAWAIWPPQWDLEEAPLLSFPTWAQAFRAAYDRAGFAATPPVHQPTFLRNQIEDTHGQA